MGDESLWKPALTAHCAYLTLAIFDNEQGDMLNRIDTMEAKNLEKTPAFKALIKTFIDMKLSPWPLPFDAEIRNHESFQDSPHDGGAARWTMLRKRMVQHNLRVMSE